MISHLGLIRTFLKTITSISELMKESHRIAELAQQVLNQLNSESEQ